ncbi:MAG: hypothetical protein ACI8X5_002393 [Planctomycetota bacterium]|jgi:hypothetical protein
MLLISILIATAGAQSIELPESLSSRAWASVGAETVAVDLAEELLADEPWLTAPATEMNDLRWERWGEWLRAESEAPEIDPRRRAGLVLFAAEQERWGNAWAHFERLGAAPEWAASLLPRLLVGAPATSPTGPGGFPRGLAEGVLLKPALPPAIEDDRPGSLRPRTMKISGLRVGQAVLDMKVVLEPSGIEVDILHVSGEAVTLSILLPEPPGQEIRVEYIDWMRQDERRAPLELTLLPGEEEHTLFGRFRHRGARLPSLPQGSLPVGFRRAGLRMEAPDDPQLAALARPLSQALGLLFEIPSEFVIWGSDPTPSPWTTTVLHLAHGLEGRQSLISIVSLVERYVLALGLK